MGCLCYSYNEVRREMDSGYPRLITQDFPGIGSKVDAAFENYGKRMKVINIQYLQRD